ncbi:hypothetical protein [Streptomyces atratus]|uniref:hypothetical protein n=1 Tax=Streptomyces atratus TaxID=1893 RepID=UPI00225A8E32|nr:hypothetical protein [Streptomyces atratus]MCX5346035.1 IS110 family transposase [Streptomyces atratus]
MAHARRSARGRGKSDPIDAKAVARVALREPDLPKACLDGPADAKVVADHRRLLARQRTAAANKLLWFLHEIDPELPVPREAFAVCASSTRWRQFWLGAQELLSRALSIWSQNAGDSPSGSTLWKGDYGAWCASSHRLCWRSPDAG